MATNPVVSLPDSAMVRRALANCEFVVVSDCVSDTDTAACADLLLPAMGWGEGRHGNEFGALYFAPAPAGAACGRREPTGGW